MSGKDQDEAGEKCKAPGFSEPWMGRFLDDAISSVDIIGACARAGINLVELRVARARDPAFDFGCAELDSAIRLAAVEAVRARAAAGDPKAVRLLIEGMGGLVDQAEGGPGPTPPPPFPTTVPLECPVCGFSATRRDQFARQVLDQYREDLHERGPRDGAAAYFCAPITPYFSQTVDWSKLTRDRLFSIEPEIAVLLDPAEGYGGRQLVVELRKIPPEIRLAATAAKQLVADVGARAGSEPEPGADEWRCPRCRVVQPRREGGRWPCDGCHQPTGPNS